MGVQISIKVNDKEVTKLFRKIEVGTASFREPLTNASDELIDKFFGKKVFETEGAATGSRWQALRAKTLQMRARRYGHYKKAPVATNKMMIWTGALQKGFKKTVTAFKSVIENRTSYFKYTEQKRPVFRINSEVINIITKHFLNYFKKILK